MKRFLITTAALTINLTATVSALAAPANTATMTSRYTQGGTYSSAAYSFLKNTHDSNVTRNSYNILFEARSDFEDYFGTVMVVDQSGQIVDLGAKACSTVGNGFPTGPAPEVGAGGYPYAVDRQRQPMFWLEYTDAWNQLQQGSSSKALVKAGHCYLLQQVDTEGRTIAMFHVKNHVKSQSVEIDEIEVFSRSRFSK